jgi:hypothetical protein
MDYTLEDAMYELALAEDLRPTLDLLLDAFPAWGDALVEFAVDLAVDRLRPDPSP